MLLNPQHTTKTIPILCLCQTVLWTGITAKVYTTIFIAVHGSLQLKQTVTLTGSFAHRYNSVGNLKIQNTLMVTKYTNLIYSH